jgi:ribosomal protein S25
MDYQELMGNVKARLATREAITANYIQCRYHVLQSSARKVIQDLQDEGLIGREWSVGLGGYPVVKEGVTA